MKICPKCQSSYSDETLNFCLADGSPLVTDEFSADNPSSENSWHDAETVADSGLYVAGNSRSTASGTNSPTLQLLRTPTETLSRPNSSNLKLYSVLGTALAAVVLIGGFWWLSQSRNASSVNANSSVRADNGFAVQNAKSVVPLTAPQDTQVKREVADFIESWRQTNEERDIEKHIDHYANILDNFYKESGISKNHVRADRVRAYEVYNSLSLQVDKLKITPESETSAIAVFDKSWTFKNAQKTSTGSVQQELRLAKQSDRWYIVGEKDLNVHFINNRLNQTEENASPPANAPGPANAVNTNIGNANQTSNSSAKTPVGK